MYKNIVDGLKVILEEAGEMLLRQTVTVSSHKTANDLLTENDIRTEQFLIEKIKALIPNVNIVSEETNADNRLTGLSVVIDPIDGTCNYAVGSDRFGIQVAVFEEEECVASILQFPIQKETIYAIKGEGAYLGDKRLYVDTSAVPGDGMLLISDYYSNVWVPMDVQFELVKALQKTFLKTRHLGAACVDFASIVKKEGLAYVSYYSNIWDMAPGLLIAKEAGAVYSMVDGSPYRYGEAGLALANNEETLHKIVDAYKLIGSDVH